MQPLSGTRCLIALAALSLCALPVAARGRQLEFRHVVLELPGPPAKIVSTDLDDDGRRDLVVVMAYTEIEETGEGAEKRRRQIIILRQGSMIAVRSDIPFASGRLEIGRDLKLIMHWDSEVEGILNYLELDRDGISETKSLALGEVLNHDQAVELIRGLTN